MADIIPVMTKKPYPSQTQDRFIVRLPDGLRDRIALEAKANGRSMNSEIVAALEATFPPPPSPNAILHSLDYALSVLKEHPQDAEMWRYLENKTKDLSALLIANGLPKSNAG